MKNLSLYSANTGAKVKLQGASLGEELKSKLTSLGIVKNNVADVIFKSKAAIVLRIEGIKIAVSSKISKSIMISNIPV